MACRVLVSLALCSSVVLGQEDCANWTCPEGYQAKADASSLVCDGDCDEVQDLYLCCNQLCSGFMCNTYLTLPSVACAGPCDPVKDLARCCDIPMLQDESIQLLRASAASEVRHVDRLVAMKVNSSTAPGGTTALHFAALHGHTAMLRRLLAGGADVNALDDHGWAPLHLAAGAGSDPTLRLLAVLALEAMGPEIVYEQEVLLSRAIKDPEREVGEQAFLTLRDAGCIKGMMGSMYLEERIFSPEVLAASKFATENSDLDGSSSSSSSDSEEVDDFGSSEASQEEESQGEYDQDAQDKEDEERREEERIRRMVMGMGT